MGPCRVTKKASHGVCGADVDTIVARNFLRSVASGTSAHSDHGRTVAELFLAAARGEAKDYKIKDVAKLHRLAAELGITVDELKAAHEEVRAATMEDGADGPRADGPRAFGSHGRPASGDVNEHQALLAEALGDGVTVEDLQAAQVAANAAWLAETVDAGALTQDQVDLMAARQALQEAIDGDTLMAEVAQALDIDLADLLAALEDRPSLFTLLEASGVTIQDFMAAQQDAYEAAVQDAVPDIISQEQADQLLSGGMGGHGPGNMHGGFRGPGGGAGGGGGHFGGRGASGGFGPANGTPPITESGL
jgi:hypothetical protein